MEKTTASTPAGQCGAIVEYLPYSELLLRGYWTAAGMCTEGLLLYHSSRASDAVQILNLAIASWRSTGATLFTPTQLVWLAAGYAELGQLNDAYRTAQEAMTVIETSGETWFEAEVNRMIGEIALLSREAETAKSEALFKRALAIARQQKAKSWELRAAMSMARLWRDQGRRDEARELLAPSMAGLQKVSTPAI